MRFVFYVVGAFTLAIMALAACNSREPVNSAIAQKPVASQVPPNPADKARRITAPELYDLWQAGKVLVVDTRTEPAFKESHIKGAILIPANEVPGKIDELPKDKMIVTYCT